MQSVLIGFGLKSQCGVACDDPMRLQSLGCDRIYLADDEAARNERLEQVLEFLRPGDTLVVTGLERLASDLDSLLIIAARLQEIGVKLYAFQQQIVPESADGQAFLKSCQLLTKVAESLRQYALTPAPNGKIKRGPGRPRALSAADHAKARRLLWEERASVLEVARQLRVSPATIYRHFPRAHRGPFLSPRRP